MACIGGTYKLRSAAQRTSVNRQVRTRKPCSIFRHPAAVDKSCRRCIQVHTAQPNQLSVQDKIRAHGAVFSVQAVFALWYIVGHIVLSENDPLTFALARELLAASALVFLARKFEGEVKVKNRKDLGEIVILGLMCYAVVVGFMFALSDLPEVTVAVAQPLVPALALGMSAALGMEALSYVSLFGIVLSVAGAVAFTIFNAAGANTSGGHAFGYAALVLELLAYAAQMTYLPSLSKRYRPLTLTAMYYTVATVASAATLVARERHDLFHIPSQATMLLDPVVFCTLVFAVLGPTVFSFTALSYSSKKLKPSVNSSYITLQPVLVAVLSLMLFGNALTGAEVSSGCVVLGGLILTVIGNPSVDRAWQEFASDLPNNVPQTLNEVADAAVTVTETVAGTVGTAVSDSVLEMRGSLEGTVQETVAEVSDSLKEMVDDVGSTVKDTVEELVSVHEKKS